MGEIRDGETAGIAMRSAITGHLVMSTLHTNDAVSAVYRLRDIGVEPWLIASALRGVISQRLVRKICPHCKTAYQPSEEELALLGMPEDSQTTFYKGVGCPECRHTGYVGRRAAFEILMVNREVRRLVNDDAAYDELLAAREEKRLPHHAGQLPGSGPPGHYHGGGSRPDHQLHIGRMNKAGETA